jgi:hypothetical protein
MEDGSFSSSSFFNFRFEKFVSTPPVGDGSEMVGERRAINERKSHLATRYAKSVVILFRRHSARLFLFGINK